MKTNCKSFVQEMGAVSTSLRRQAENLHSLSNSFAHTGNAQAASQLASVAAELNTQAEQVQHWVGEVVFDRVSGVEQATHNMVEAALADPHKGVGR